MQLLSPVACFMAFSFRGGSGSAFVVFAIFVLWIFMKPIHLWFRLTARRLTSESDGEVVELVADNWRWVECDCEFYTVYLYDANSSLVPVDGASIEG